VLLVRLAALLQQLRRHRHSNDFRLFARDTAHTNGARDESQFFSGKPFRFQAVLKRGPLGFAANQAYKFQIALQALALESGGHHF